MKLLVQSDDYGITRAASCGIIHGIKNGLIRNTGLFSNMPWAEECVEMIRPYLNQIALGIDLNASTGPSVLGYTRVPELCHEDGSFLTSSENRAKDAEAENHDHVNYEQVFAEFDAQVQRFIELVGELPAYIHAHAYGTATTVRARTDIAKKYHLPYSEDVMAKDNVGMNKSWYQLPAGPEKQLTNDPVSVICADEAGMLEKEYGYIICHAGYVDLDLVRLSSFNTCRAVDLAAMCDPRFAKWVKDNDIELITYKDLTMWAL